MGKKKEKKCHVEVKNWILPEYEWKKKLTKKYAFEKNKFPAKTKFSGEGNCGNIKKTSLLEGEKFHFDNVEKNI